MKLQDMKLQDIKMPDMKMAAFLDLLNKSTNNDIGKTKLNRLKIKI